MEGATRCLRGARCARKVAKFQIENFKFEKIENRRFSQKENGGGGAFAKRGVAISTHKMMHSAPSCEVKIR